MKIIKIIFFILLALSLIVYAGIFIFFETFDADQYLPQIIKKASLALGRPVSIGHVGLGFSEQGISLDAWPLIIADDLGFTTQPFIKVDRVRVSLDVRPLILQREIHVTDILLQSPQIHFIRSQEGNINVRSIGSVNMSHAITGVLSKQKASAFLKGEAISERTTNPVEIASSVIAKSETTKPSLNDSPLFYELLRVSGEHLRVSGLRTMRTKEGLGEFVKSIKIQDASISFIDQSQGMPLDIWLTNINVSLNDFSLSKPFRSSFDASLYSNDPNVHGSALVFLDLSKRSVQISDLSLHMDLSHLDMDQLKGISPEMPDNPIFKNITGVVQLNAAHLGIGASGDLTANGDITIAGVIKNFNIIKTVLSHTLGVFGNIDNLLNGQLKDTLGAKDTVIEKAEAKFSLRDKAVFIDGSLIKTNIFEFKAQGSVDQGLNMDMQTMLHLNSNVSAALVNELEGLKFLCDDSKRITIDASLKGVIPYLQYKPNKDFRKKGKKAINAMFRQLFRS